jgi:hypothetical protein
MMARPKTLGHASRNARVVPRRRTEARPCAAPGTLRAPAIAGQVVSGAVPGGVQRCWAGGLAVAAQVMWQSRRARRRTGGPAAADRDEPAPWSAVELPTHDTSRAPGADGGLGRPGAMLVLRGRQPKGIPLPHVRPSRPPGATASRGGRSPVLAEREASSTQVPEEEGVHDRPLPGRVPVRRRAVPRLGHRLEGPARRAQGRLRRPRRALPAHDGRRDPAGAPAPVPLAAARNPTIGVCRHWWGWVASARGACARALAPS